jgi:hypothetical protein
MKMKSIFLSIFVQSKTVLYNHKLVSSKKMSTEKDHESAQIHTRILATPLSYIVEATYKMEQLLLSFPQPYQDPGISTPSEGLVRSVIDRIRFTLDIETTLPRLKERPTGGRTSSRLEHPDAMIKDVRAVWGEIEPPDDCNCPFSCALHHDKPYNQEQALYELQHATAFVGHKITLHQTYSDIENPKVITDTFTKTFENDKGFFTASELVSCIAEWEKNHREHKWWCGAIDAQEAIDAFHVYFEDLSESRDFERNIIKDHYTPCYDL